MNNWTNGNCGFCNKQLCGKKIYCYYCGNKDNNHMYLLKKYLHISKNLQLKYIDLKKKKDILQYCEELPLNGGCSENNILKLKYYISELDIEIKELKEKKILADKYLNNIKRTEHLKTEFINKFIKEIENYKDNNFNLRAIFGLKSIKLYFKD